MCNEEKWQNQQKNGCAAPAGLWYSREGSTGQLLDVTGINQSTVSFLGSLFSVKLDKGSFQSCLRGEQGCLVWLRAALCLPGLEPAVWASAGGSCLKFEAPLCHHSAYQIWQNSAVHLLGKLIRPCLLPNESLCALDNHADLQPLENPSMKFIK